MQCDWAWTRRQIGQTLKKYLLAYEMNKVGTETMQGWPHCQLLGRKLWLRRQGGKWFRCGIRKVKNQKHASGLWMKLKAQLENSFQWFCHFSPAASKLGVKLICYSRSTLRQQKIPNPGTERIKNIFYLVFCHHIWQWVSSLSGLSHFLSIGHLKNIN